MRPRPPSPTAASAAFDTAGGGVQAGRGPSRLASRKPPRTWTQARPSGPPSSDRLSKVSPPPPAGCGVRDRRPRPGWRSAKATSWALKIVGSRGPTTIGGVGVGVGVVSVLGSASEWVRSRRGRGRWGRRRRWRRSRRWGGCRCRGGCRSRRCRCRRLGQGDEGVVEGVGDRLGETSRDRLRDRGADGVERGVVPPRTAGTCRSCWHRRRARRRSSPCHPGSRFRSPSAGGRSPE